MCHGIGKTMIPIAISTRAWTKSADPLAWEQAIAAADRAESKGD
jgi:hypothetical protein